MSNPVKIALAGFACILVASGLFVFLARMAAHNPTGAFAIAGGISLAVTLVFVVRR